MTEGDPTALPATPLALLAHERARAVVPPLLLAHSFRTFLLGRAYARAKAVDLDEEGFYVAALFHDFGLAAGRSTRAEPFPRSSGRDLEAFLVEQGWGREKIGPLRDAIELHMGLLPRWRRGPIVGLLQVGAWMDVTRLRRLSVWRAASAIERAYPRAGLDWRFPPLLLGVGPLRCARLLLGGR
ncbi:MAG: hypothetical protein ACAI25_03180 [Planctomycetota bacterium]